MKSRLAFIHSTEFRSIPLFAIAVAALGTSLAAVAQTPGAPATDQKDANFPIPSQTQPAPSLSPVPPQSPDNRPRDGRGPGRFGPMREKLQVLKQFDEDKSGWLNSTERQTAREFVVKERAERMKRREADRPAGDRFQRGPGRPGSPDGAQANDRPFGPPGPGGSGGPGGGPGFFGRHNNLPAPEPGKRIAPSDITDHPATPLYDLQTVRTLFLEFENADWEKELVDFHDTDVEVPARLTVDGKLLDRVGVHFRGMSSFMMVGDGRKRSLNLSIDYVNEDQRLRGYRTLNLLNSAGDPTLLCAVLYDQIAREYIPAPKANFVRIVINGESWGIYPNVQQFNKEFIEEWFGTKKGARWKAPGSPGGRAGLEYTGDDVAEYKKRFEIKSKDDPRSWAALINLCRVLNTTPVAELEKALEPILDIDGALKFLALENVFINTDGYWVRSSDFNLYQDQTSRFHIIPHDVNETFREPEGPGMERERTKGVELDPLVAAADARKPLLSKLLAVPTLRARYLGYVRKIADEWLDWKKIGPLAEQYHALIASDVQADTRKLASFDAFEKGISEDVEEQGFRGPRHHLSLKTFVERRREYLLHHPEIESLASAGTNQIAAP